MENQQESEQRATQSSSTEQNSNYVGLELASNHVMLLHASRILPAVAADREYRTIIAVEQAVAAGFTEPYQQRLPALLLPIRNVKGEVAMYRIRPDCPRLSNDGKPIKYESPVGSTACLDIPHRSQPQLRDTAIPLHIAEGERKADCLISLGLCAIGISGVTMWQRAGKPLPDWDAIELKGRAVSIYFDSDLKSNPNVYKQASKLARYLKSRGALVTIVSIPPAQDGSKQGIDDYIFAGGRIEGLKTFERPTRQNQRPIIFDAADLIQHVDQAEEALGHCAEVFVFKKRIQRVVVGDAGDVELARVRFASIEKAAAVELISRELRWLRQSKNGLTVVVTPKEVIDALFARAEWKFIRHVDRLVHHPYVDLNGAIISGNGYHADRRVYIDCDVEIEAIPVEISADDIDDAMTLLRWPTESVRFDDDASRDAPVLLALSIVDLPNRDKPPMFFITAVFPGSGKTIIAHLAHTIVFGYEAATKAFSTNAEEVRKSLSTCVDEGRQVAVLDNIPNGHHFESADTDQFLTSKIRADRRLGGNSSIEGFSNMLVIGTGNNVSVAEDSLRRLTHCRISRPYPQPPVGHARYGIDPVAEIKTNRAAYLRALLIVLAAFRRTLPSARPGAFVLPSFEGWSRHTLHAFLSAGGRFDASSGASLADSDDWTAEAIERVIRAAIANGKQTGFTTNDVFRWRSDDQDLAMALDSAAEASPANAKQVGRFIGRCRNRPVHIDEKWISIASRKKAAAGNTRGWFLKIEPDERSEPTPVQTHGDRDYMDYEGFKTEIPIGEEGIHTSAHAHTRVSGVGYEPLKPTKPLVATQSESVDTLNQPGSVPSTDPEPPRVEQTQVVDDRQPQRLEPPTSDDDEVIEFERGQL